MCAGERARKAHPRPARGGAGHPPGTDGAGQVDAPALQLQPRRGPAPDAALRHAPGQRARKDAPRGPSCRAGLCRARLAPAGDRCPPARGRCGDRASARRAAARPRAKGRGGSLRTGRAPRPRRFARRDAARPAPHPRAGARRIRTVRRAGAWRRPFFVARRHRLGQDGGLHPPRAPGAGAGQRRHRPRAGDRPHTADGLVVPPALRRRRGRPPFRSFAGREVRRMAAHPLGRGARGHRRALGGVRAACKCRRHRRR